MNSKLRLVFVIFIISSFILIIVSCTNLQNSNSDDLNSGKNSIIEFVELYRRYAQEFDKKM